MSKHLLLSTEEDAKIFRDDLLDKQAAASLSHTPFCFFILFCVFKIREMAKLTCVLPLQGSQLKCFYPDMLYWLRKQKTHTHSRLGKRIIQRNKCVCGVRVRERERERDSGVKKG